MLNYLRQWNYTPEQLARIKATLESGKTVRTTHQPDINCIYPSDDGYTIVEIDANGREKEKEFETL
jgi:hypothetical protein